ncbi:hypothetical protein GOODEAATRI_022821 [Goodea atripinnis]|uniref:Uncharacterized protein n=1 Tax=Goodea atripinnis TaxID=208336 RepID=A0ABV0MJZ6_9TELE
MVPGTPSESPYVLNSGVRPREPTFLESNETPQLLRMWFTTSNSSLQSAGTRSAPSLRAPGVRDAFTDCTFKLLHQSGVQHAQADGPGAPQRNGLPLSQRRRRRRARLKH